MQTLGNVATGQTPDQPPEKVAWTKTKNVTILPGKIAPLHKPVSVNSQLNGSAIRAIFGIYSDVGHEVSVFMCTENSILSTTNNFVSTRSHTPTIPLLTDAARPEWQFEYFCGLPIISNGLNFAYKEGLSGGAVVPLLGIRSRFKVMGVIGERLFIADLSATASNSSFPPTTPAEGGTAVIACSDIRNPESWVKAIDVGSDSQEFTDSQGKFLAKETPLQILSYAHNRGILLTNQSIWSIVTTTDDYIFHMGVRFQNISSVSQRAACRVDGSETMYVMATDDIYRIGEKAGLTSIAYGKVRDDIYARLNRSAIARVFTFYIKETRQVHFCVPTGSSLECDVDFIYDEVLGTWSEADCDFTCFTAFPFPLVGTLDGRLMRFDGDRSNRQTVLESGDVIGSSTRDTFHRVSAFGKNTDSFEYQVGTRQVNDSGFSWSRKKRVGEPFNLRGHAFRYRIYASEGSGDWELSRVSFETSKGGIREV